MFILPRNQNFAWQVRRETLNTASKFKTKGQQKTDCLFYRDTVIKFKNVATDKTGKAMENACLVENIFGDSQQVQDCCSGFSMDRLDDHRCPPVALFLDIHCLQLQKKRRVWVQIDGGRSSGWHIVDVDLCGPSIPRMMNVESKGNTTVFFWCTQARTCCYIEELKKWLVYRMFDLYRTRIPRTIKNVFFGGL
ncbi:hypothetical protein ACROYT_G031503 [Oculina patagonica]